jgi:hypothetical protein
MDVMAFRVFPTALINQREKQSRCPGMISANGSRISEVNR